MKLKVRDIIINYFNENKYTGLYNPGECSCRLDDDLFDYCSESCFECVPGYARKCDACDLYEDKSTCIFYQEYECDGCVNGERPGGK